MCKTFSLDFVLLFPTFELVLLLISQGILRKLDSSKLIGTSLRNFSSWYRKGGKEEKKNFSLSRKMVGVKKKKDCSIGTSAGFFSDSGVKLSFFIFHFSFKDQKTKVGKRQKQEGSREREGRLHRTKTSERADVTTN